VYMLRALLQIYMSFAGTLDPSADVQGSFADVSLFQVHRALLQMYLALGQMCRQFGGYKELFCRYIGLFCK